MHEDGKLYVKDLLQHKKLDICIIIEPRCKFARVRHYWNSLSFSPTYLEEAVGFRGGIWVLKNDRTTVSMRLLHQHNQAITFELWRDNYSWACTAIYASPIPSHREVLWSHLSEVRRTMALPWLLTRDFNEVLLPSEVREGVGILWPESGSFC